MKKLEDRDFTDDLALLTHCLQDMQENIDSSGEVSQHVGLKISKKTKVMHATKMQEAQISIRGALVEDVGEFVYLGSKIRYQVSGIHVLTWRNRWGHCRKDQKSQTSLCHPSSSLEVHCQLDTC